MAQTKAGAMLIAAKRIGISIDEYAANREAGLKWCTTCKAWHPIDEFDIDRSRGDGLTTACRATRYRRTAPGPTKRERANQRAAGFDWCRECKTWIALAEVHAGLCRTHRNEYERLRYETDPDYREHRKALTKDRRLNVIPVPPEGKEALLDEFDGLCAYCLAPANSFDHIVPVSESGATMPWNIVPACRECNSSKKDQDFMEWMAKKGFKGHDRLWEREVLEHLPLSRS